MENTMQLVLTEADLSKLKPSTRADLIATLFPRLPENSSDNPLGLEWDDVVNLTPGQIEEFMSGCSDETKAGLRVIAERGPTIHASLLAEAGIENYGHFQGRVTKRTRTVTGDKHAFLFTWDDWTSEENDGVGHYAVTEATHRSLRMFFNLD
jgi:hypothetical protein